LTAIDTDARGQCLDRSLDRAIAPHDSRHAPKQPTLSAPTTLLLIRHGETAWNAEHRIQGQLDIPLSANGVWQAGRLAQRLGQVPGEHAIDAVYTSDLARAWLTAQPLAQALDVPLQSEPRLRERNFGLFQGHTIEEVATHWPDHFVAWRARDPAWLMPAGESGNQLIARSFSALAAIVRAHTGGTVAVVTHGGVLDAAYRAARSLSWDAPREHLMLNAAINRMQGSVHETQVASANAMALRLAIIDWCDDAHLLHDAADAIAASS
jgi:probable phosphoglycerate mutase